MTHMIGGPPDPLLTNAIVYRDIALAALARSQEWDSKHVKPRGDGGRVIDLDLAQPSFKDSLIAIVFAGMYMEAALWIVGCRRLGIPVYEKIDKKKTLEDRVQHLGILDTQLHSALKTYREARNSLVHEKAVPSSQDISPSGTGQDEAKKAVALMLRLEQALKQLQP
jgi:hypothetical protein